MKLAEELIVEIVPVGQHNQRRVLHRRMPDHPPGIEQHRKTLAAPLCVPDYARPAVSRFPAVHPARRVVPGRHAAGSQGFFDGCVDRVELVIASDDLVQSAAVRVFLEDDEVLQQIQKPLPLEDALHQHVQLQHGLRGVSFAVDRPPDLEPLLIRRQRADPGLQPVAHHEHGVVGQQRGDFRLVGLHLGVGGPDRRVFVGRVLQLDQGQRQTVDEDHDIGPPVVLSFDHRELLDRQPVVRIDVVEVDQPDVVAGDRAIRPRVFDRDPFPQQPLKRPVGLDE